MHKGGEERLWRLGGVKILYGRRRLSTSFRVALKSAVREKSLWEDKKKNPT